MGKKKLPPDRNFGLVMACAGLVTAILFARSDRPIAAVVAGLFAAAVALAALAKPRLLAPLNRGWMSLGNSASRVVSPIVLGILFFGLFTPVALLLRLLGRDELRLRRQPGATSYWRLRDPPGPDSASFRRQF